jgi:regulator of protease activity HflC (stomatin/prohibitin superfamily)
MMDPATKSLADALRITYRLLQATMAVLAIMFLLSGFQSVKESERGIRLTWGQIQESDLPPGFRFSFPEPIGELIRVPTGEERLEIRKEFFPALSQTEDDSIAKGEGIASLAGGGADSLDPNNDGQLITADRGIVHTRWSVSFRRTDAQNWARNVPDEPELEKRLILAAVKRAVVRAAASLTLDEVLRGRAEGATASTDGTDGGGSSGRLEQIAKAAAQEELDRLGMGIQVQLVCTVRMPPRRVMTKYNEVVSAQSRAGAEVQNAQRDASASLTKAAGEGAPVLLRLIEQYEREIASAGDFKGGTGTDVPGAATLDLIDRFIMGERIELDGAPVTARVFGDVTSEIADAREHRSRVVNEIKRDVALYNAKWEAFQASPLVAVTSEWSGAMSQFMARDSVQSIFIPASVRQFTLNLNRDPAISKEQEMARNKREAEEAGRAAAEARRRERFQAGKVVSPASTD